MNAFWDIYDHETEKSFSILSWMGSKKKSKLKEDKVLKRLKYVLHDNNDNNNSKKNNDATKNLYTDVIMNKIQNDDEDEVIKTTTTEPFNILSWTKKSKEVLKIDNNNTRLCAMG
mmetsp:Transcript_6002/g.6897  ORF Transcript_6002/g.6897 Transcript_6002/m.6897 type:complete len:115 (+) Transcript_6002:2-346(+)